MIELPTVEYETVAPLYQEGDRVTAYGDIGTYVRPNGEKDSIIQFDRFSMPVSVPNGKVTRA